MNLPDCITIEEPTPGYPVYRINHATATARVALLGAHVMEWVPADQEAVLYLSPQAIFQEGKAIRGGIPVCWPWFNAHPTDASKPMHGFARNHFWHLAEASASEHGVTLVFTFASDAETLALWPHAFAAKVEIRIGAALEVVLTTHNTGGETISLSEALHSYLTVGDITQVTVRGLAGLQYLDTVGPLMMRRQSGDILIDQEVDRQYVSNASVQVEDLSLNRTLLIEKWGSGTTVVWNPWIAKAARLADLPDDSYPHFLCIEAANAGPGVVTVKAGGSHQIATRISVV